MNAAHPINAMLNYAYAVALGNVTRVVVGLGLDPMFGFLHSPKPGRLSLSYDVLELVRSRIDTEVFTWSAKRVFA
jgi:CRISP-associated protein Cas1